MKKIYLLHLILLFLYSCINEKTEDKSAESISTDTPDKVFNHMALLVTPGLPKGFSQRDYTISSNGKIAYTSIELPSRSRKFLIQVNIPEKLAVLAPVSGKFNDFEPFLVPGDSILLFSSDRPLYEGDTVKDFNLWWVKVNGLEMGTPQPFDSLINTSADEYYPSMNRNGDLYFTAVYDGRDSKDDLYRAMKTEAGYGKPALLSFCDEQYYEFNSYIFPDDQTLIYTSYGRSEEIGGGDLYYVKRDSTGNWGKPRMFTERLNTKALDFSPFVKGDTLFFTSKRQDVSWNTRSFKYLAEITGHADTAAIGKQGIYIIPLSSILPQE